VAALFGSTVISQRKTTVSSTWQDAVANFSPTKEQAQSNFVLFFCSRKAIFLQLNTIENGILFETRNDQLPSYGSMHTYLSSLDLGSKFEATRLAEQDT
jgi:hypothetical protein